MSTASTINTMTGDSLTNPPANTTAPITVQLGHLTANCTSEEHATALEKRLRTEPGLRGTIRYGKGNQWFAVIVDRHDRPLLHGGPWTDRDTAEQHLADAIEHLL